MLKEEQRLRNQKSSTGVEVSYRQGRPDALAGVWC